MTIIVGGEDSAEKNTICGNYKSGYDPSLDQQIRDDSGDLYETYKDNNNISAYCGAPSGLVHNLTKDTYYNTIQAALDDANTNNAIEVADGIYDESITFPSDKVIILQSVNGPSSTIIRGNDNSATVTTDASSEGTTLEDFTISHASGNEGRGIYTNGNLNIKNCIISGNSIPIPSYGGGIHNNKGSITITESTISGNSARDWGGGINNYGNLTITGCTISDNIAQGDAGGVYNGTSSTITGCTISGNSAGDDDGGIYLYEHDQITIGGSSDANKNTICGNYKVGYSPSLDQQIGDSSGSLYESYMDTNYISAYCE